MPKTRGAVRYVEYTTRSQNIRKPESASQGKVAQKRYKGIIQRGAAATLGQGCTTGHQNASPAPKKQACSSSCTHCKCNASSNTAGICHTINASAAPSHATARRVAKCPSHFTGPHRSSGATTPRAIHPGSPCSNGSAGAPSRINGGATVISSRCCTMWTVSDKSSNAVNGDPIATHTQTIPEKKAARRRTEINPGNALRKRNQPKA